MTEFQPKIVGFASYHIDENWIVKIDHERPDERLRAFCNYYMIKVKDPNLPIVLRMGADYPLEIFFFEGVEVTIRYNKNDSKLNEMYFNPSEISFIQFPNV